MCLTSFVHRKIDELNFDKTKQAKKKNSLCAFGKEIELMIT